MTRRRAIARMALSGGTAVLAITELANAADKRHSLYGKWHVRCPGGHVDVVADGTRQHKCQTCGKQCFVDGKVTVMCPSGHANTVSLDDVDVLQSYKCKTVGCGKECEGW